MKNLKTFVRGVVHPQGRMPDTLGVVNGRNLVLFGISLAEVIQTTEIPYLIRSSLKGSLRSRCDEKNRIEIFGAETTDDTSDEFKASAAQFSDQRLLLLPIRSLAGTFAWVTSPYILRRFVRDLQDVQVTVPASIPQIQDANTCRIANQNSKIVLTNSQVYLEDLDLTAQASEEVAKWGQWIGKQVFPDDTAWQNMLTERICIVHDDVLTFMLDTATEITARIKMQEDSKTVQSGGLWYEEALPTETILSGFVLAIPSNKVKSEKVFEVLNQFKGQAIQFGGKATIGRGMCRMQLTTGEV